MPEWSPDIDVDEELARRLIRGQFPALALSSLERIGEGWDNTVWLADGDLAFRFPRRQVAVDGAVREMAVLPRLAPLLPLPVPCPTHLGSPAPDDGYPWAFFGAPLLPGREACEAGLDDPQRCALARPLALFLRSLHSADVAGTLRDAGLPRDPQGRGDMGTRVRRTRTALGDVQRLRLWSPDASVIDLLASARMLPVPEPRSVVHGDLHFRHLLVEAGALSGVIDWGDLCLGTPAIDLQLLWSFLPPEGRGDFLAAYGPVSDEELLGARVLAFSLSALLALYGHQVGNRPVLDEAIGSLRRASTG
jgi:aminoglycoside phosphotransferase (APT) family kinase protein